MALAWSTSTIARAVSITDCWASSCGLLAGQVARAAIDIGLGLVECGLEVAVIDSREDLAGLHPLIVSHEHRGDVARDLGAIVVLSAWT